MWIWYNSVILGLVGKWYTTPFAWVNSEFDSRRVHSVANQNHNIFHYLFTAIYNLVKALIRSFAWLLGGIAGLLVLQTRRTPFDILIGLPLLLVGGGFVVNSLWTVFLAFFYPKYNKGVCIWCSNKNWYSRIYWHNLFHAVKSINCPNFLLPFI